MTKTRNCSKVYKILTRLKWQSLPCTVHTHTLVRKCTPLSISFSFQFKTFDSADKKKKNNPNSQKLTSALLHNPTMFTIYCGSTQLREYRANKMGTTSSSFWRKDSIRSFFVEQWSGSCLYIGGFVRLLYSSQQQQQQQHWMWIHRLIMITSQIK